jgi:hypothetical protein
MKFQDQKQQDFSYLFIISHPIKKSGKKMN